MVGRLLWSMGLKKYWASYWGCVDFEHLNSPNLTLVFGVQCAAGTMQPYPVGKGGIPLLRVNRVDPLQLL